MRHTALLTLMAFGLAACEPLPPRPELSPVIAPIGTGVGLPQARPITTTVAPGTFAPEPPGRPIIEETLTDVPGDLISRPAEAPLDPSISAAVDAAGTPPETSGPANTLPLGQPAADPFAPLPPGDATPVDPFAPGPTVTPLPDEPFGTVPGGPLPDPQNRPGPRAPGWHDAAAPSAPPVVPAAAEAAGISREQDFAAVQDRSIEMDAERLAALRAARLEVAPEPVPLRPADAAPNIVGYALATRHAVGQPVHRRGGLRALVRVGDGCARFASQDRAQEAFLAAGGPARDRHGLDPDGDGFACGWDPAPFRAALN